MNTTSSFVVLERRGQALGLRQRLTRPSVGVAPTPSSLDLELVEIPAGRFLMGSPPSEEGRSEDEGPLHEVSLESFFLGRTPITQAQWREVAGWVERPGERWGLDLSGKLEP
jgi:formylglycine-generating enzyme required for sulfatase activity